MPTLLVATKNRTVKITDEAPADRFEQELHVAVLRYSAERFRALSRKVIFRMRRMPASGIFAGVGQHRNLWHEYCHEMRESPHMQLARAWESLLYPLAADALSSLSDREALLLTVGCNDFDRQTLAINQVSLIEQVTSVIREEAAW